MSRQLSLIQVWAVLNSPNATRPSSPGVLALLYIILQVYALVDTVLLVQSLQVSLNPMNRGVCVVPRN